MNKTSIEYLDFSWNPLAMRCSPISDGCKHCWHLRAADRLATMPQFDQEVRDAYAGKRPPLLIESRLNEPLKRKKSSVIGVQFMGDLFHHDIDFEIINRIVSVMCAEKQHQFLVLTKRLDRVLAFVLWLEDRNADTASASWWPNIWWGTSVENQRRADERIPKLLKVPGKHWLSVEPMLEKVSFDYDGDSCMCGGPANHSPLYENHDPVPMSETYLWGIDWVTCGAETGLGARPFKNEWAIDLLEQCRVADVPFFMKKVQGGKEPPTELMVREYPQW